MVQLLGQAVPIGGQLQIQTARLLGGGFFRQFQHFRGPGPVMLRRSFNLVRHIGPGTFPYSKCINDCLVSKKMRRRRFNCGPGHEKRPRSPGPFFSVARSALLVLLTLLSRFVAVRVLLTRLALLALLLAGLLARLRLVLVLGLLIVLARLVVLVRHIVLQTLGCPQPLVNPSSPPSFRKKARSEEHTSELQSHSDLVCRLLLEKKKKTIGIARPPHAGCRPRAGQTVRSLRPR